MSVVVNGVEEELPEPVTLRELLQRRGIDDARGLAVAINEEVVPRERWDVVKVGRGDRVEIVRAVQGG